jgi:hypothetical protein
MGCRGYARTTQPPRHGFNSQGQRVVSIRTIKENRKGSLIAVALELLHSRKYPIVHRVLNVLLTAEVF